jgi:hypothetical protein
MKKEVSCIKVEKEPQNINFCQARNLGLSLDFAYILLANLAKHSNIQFQKSLRFTGTIHPTVET